MTFKEYVLHQLREMRRELLTAIDSVSEEALVSFEPCGHWPIAWLAEHCTQRADHFLHRAVHGDYLLSYGEHVDQMAHREPQPGDEYPPLAVLMDRWSAVCDAVIGFVENSSDDDLQRRYDREPYIESILRIVNHTNSHLRSIWCILGEKRIDAKWPEQQPFKA